MIGLFFGQRCARDAPDTCWEMCQISAGGGESVTKMDNQTACDMALASSQASEFKKSFICASDQLHQSLTQAPLAIFVYVFGILLVMFLVQRAAKPLPAKKPKTDK